MGRTACLAGVAARGLEPPLSKAEEKIFRAKKNQCQTPQKCVGSHKNFGKIKPDVEI